MLMLFLMIFRFWSFSDNHGQNVWDTFKISVTKDKKTFDPPYPPFNVELLNHDTFSGMPMSYFNIVRGGEGGVCDKRLLRRLKSCI